jgi:hypothetical protein
MEFLRRKASGDYLKAKYGHGSKRTLDKLATLGGGPEMIYSGRLPLYTREGLDRWAQSMLGPVVHSTSGRRALASQERETV